MYLLCTTQMSKVFTWVILYMHGCGPTGCLKDMPNGLYMSNKHIAVYIPLKAKESLCTRMQSNHHISVINNRKITVQFHSPVSI